MEHYTAIESGAATDTYSNDHKGIRVREESQAQKVAHGAALSVGDSFLPPPLLPPSLALPFLSSVPPSSTRGLRAARAGSSVVACEI